MPDQIITRGTVRWDVTRRTTGEIHWTVHSLDRASPQPKLISAGVSKSAMGARRDVATVILEYLTAQKG